MPNCLLYYHVSEHTRTCTDTHVYVHRQDPAPTDIQVFRCFYVYIYLCLFTKYLFYRFIHFELCIKALSVHLYKRYTYEFMLTSKSLKNFWNTWQSSLISDLPITESIYSREWTKTRNIYPQKKNCQSHLWLSISKRI